MASAEEELCESEVLWPEAPHDDDADADADATPSCSSSPVAPRSRTPAASARGVRVPESPTPIHPAGSRPMDIPRPATSSARRRDHEDDDGGWSATTMVPPHVLVSRRRPEGAAAFSLRSGPGHRARELSHLRNSVLRMTGFIEG